MASKLLAVKFGGLKKKSATRPQAYLNQLAWVRLPPGSNHFQSLTNSNFAALWPTEFVFAVFKDLKLLKTKKKESGSILRVSFALSKWPHLHRVYLINVCKRGPTAVHSRQKVQHDNIMENHEDWWTLQILANYYAFLTITNEFAFLNDIIEGVLPVFLG